MFCILNGLLLLTVLVLLGFFFCFIFFLFRLQSRLTFFSQRNKEVEALEKKHQHDALQLSDFLMRERQQVSWDQSGNFGNG